MRVRLCRWSWWALFLALGQVLAAPCEPALELDRHEVSQDLVYVKRAAKGDDSRQITAHLALFAAATHRLGVIDLGADTEAAPAPFAEAFRAAGFLAGVNGGFFHPDWRPLGLVVSQGQRINRLEKSRLLSGVIYSDPSGIYLLRRGQFRDHPDILDLLQSGPYLIEAGRPVKGLSTTPARRRTFIATDWHGHWVLGVVVSPLSLAELGACLASQGALTDWRVDRAINLDGGSSTGFYFDRGTDRRPVVLRPAKRVRNLLGIIPR